MIAPVAFAALSLLGAGAAPAPSTGLPPGWRPVSHGPAGGVVYQGRIANHDRGEWAGIWESF
jgi:hypothetical protein